MSKILRSLYAVLCLFAGTSVGVPATSGEWTQLAANESGGDCDFAFSGEIKSGDLVAVLDKGWLEGFPPTVCLNSPGGSLAEVYNFLRRIDALNAADRNVLFSTRVRSGDVCLSSCAILFMFGQSFGANSPFPSRQLEPGARLGFHSPFIPPERASGVAGADAFRVALEVAKLLADRSYTAITVNGPALPPELVSVVLGTPSDDMRYVEAIGELQLLGIEMTRSPEIEAWFPATQESLETLLKRICISTYALSYRQFMVQDGYRFEDLVAYIADAAQFDDSIRFAHLVREEQEFEPDDRIVGVLTGPYHVPGWFSAGAAMYCRAEIAFKPEGQRFRVPYYNVEFGLITEHDLSVIPERKGDNRIVPGGVLPIETRYGG